MCGRYVVSKSTADLMAAFSVNESYVDELQPSYNVAPTDTVPLILDRSAGEGEPVTRKLVTARWGLVPSWAKDTKGGARLINARMETVIRKAIVPEGGFGAAKDYSLVTAITSGRRSPAAAKFPPTCTTR